MIKVCHITSVHSQKDVRIFEKECVSLAQNGYEVHLVAPGENGLSQGVTIHGIGEIPVGRMRRMIWFSKRAYKIALLCDAEIYHFHDPELIPYGLRLKKKGKKVIFDSHENILEQFSEKTYIPGVIRKLCRRIFTSYIKASCSKFDAVISVDPNICRKYEQINKRVAMVTNFPKLEIVEKKEELSSYIAFAGGISRQWNHDIIIKALNQIEGIRYVLCGNADIDYLSYLKTLPGWEKVDYLGKVSHKKALEIVANSVAGIALCSYSNNTNGKQGTFGNTKLFEIMMCETPVICTRFFLWEDIVEGEKCGICLEPNDVDELIKSIRILLLDKELRTRMGYNGRKVVEKKYNWEVEKQNLLDLYQVM